MGSGKGHNKRVSKNLQHEGPILIDDHLDLYYRLSSGIRKESVVLDIDEATRVIKNKHYPMYPLEDKINKLNSEMFIMAHDLVSISPFMNGYVLPGGVVAFVPNGKYEEESKIIGDYSFNPSMRDKDKVKIGAVIASYFLSKQDESPGAAKHAQTELVFNEEGIPILLQEELDVRLNKKDLINKNIHENRIGYSARNSMRGSYVGRSLRTGEIMESAPFITSRTSPQGVVMMHVGDDVYFPPEIRKWNDEIDNYYSLPDSLRNRINGYSLAEELTKSRKYKSYDMWGKE